MCHVSGDCGHIAVAVTLKVYEIFEIVGIGIDQVTHDLVDRCRDHIGGVGDRYLR